MAVVTASLGPSGPIAPMIPQSGVDVTHVPITDIELPPRPCAMTPRLLARYPKCFGWEMAPGFDVYLWLDACLTLAHGGAAAWWLEQLGNAEFVAFRHPFRRTVGDEAEFLREQVPNSRRLQQRYAGERLDAQMRAVVKPELPLLAAGAFLYRPTFLVTSALSRWWEHNTRYHLNDQLSLAYVLWRLCVPCETIDLDIFHCPHLTVGTKPKALR